MKFILVDKIESIVPGKSIVTSKCFRWPRNIWRTTSPLSR